MPRAEFMDDAPEGDPPEGWNLEDAQIMFNTHCCHPQWWIDRYGPAWGPYLQRLTCVGINCPPDGGEPA